MNVGIRQLPVHRSLGLVERTSMARTAQFCNAESKLKSFEALCISLASLHKYREGGKIIFNIPLRITAGYKPINVPVMPRSGFYPETQVY